MPIHDQGYRRYGGGKAPRGRAWGVIAAAGIRSMFSQRRFLALLLLAWAPCVVRAVQFYIASNFSQVPFLAPTPDTFREFLDQQDVFVFFITVYVGAGLIANDRRANALQIYLSKPLTRVEYISGKLAVLMAFLLLVTWVPALVLLLVQMLFSGSTTFISRNLFLFPAITLFAFVHALTVSLVMLALSSLSNSSRYVGILYAVLIFFTRAIFGVVTGVTGDTRLSWLSFSANLRQIGNVIFRLPPPYDTPLFVSFAVVAVLIAGSLWVLERRVRGVEVVA